MNYVAQQLYGVCHSTITNDSVCLRKYLYSWKQYSCNLKDIRCVNATYAICIDWQISNKHGMLIFITHRRNTSGNK